MHCDHYNCTEEVQIVYAFTVDDHKIPSFEMLAYPEGWQPHNDWYGKTLHFCPAHSNKNSGR